MSTRREIDRLVKGKVEEFPIEYDPSHWASMEVLLDKQRDHQRVGMIYWFILGFVLLSLGLFVFLDFQKQRVQENQNTPVIATHESQTATHATIDQIPLNELSVKSNFSKANSKASGTINSNDLAISFSQDFKDFHGLTELPENKDKIYLSGTGDDQLLIDRQEPHSQKLKDSELALLDSKQEKKLETLPYEKPWKNFWNLGIGWQVENSWGWSTGAFASLGWRLHESISIRFRPGFTLRSDNTMPSESYKQVQYDFGRTDIEGEVSKLESYAVDVPLSVQLHKQRHILSFGGGIHYAFMQKVSITEKHLSNFSNFTNSRTPFYEDIDHRKAWVQPNESLYPFAELYYSYLLTPSFELGGRSRFYMPDNMQMSNRLNFAAQLVWYIN